MSSFWEDLAQVCVWKRGNSPGKGTVSATLKEKLGWIPISAGDCLREEKARYEVVQDAKRAAEAKTPS